jgi:hypothetical protein
MIPFIVSAIIGLLFQSIQESIAFFKETAFTRSYLGFVIIFTIFFLCAYFRKGKKTDQQIINK